VPGETLSVVCFKVGAGAVSCEGISGIRAVGVGLMYAVPLRVNDPAVGLRDAFAGVADDEIIVVVDARGLKIGFRVGCLKEIDVRGYSFLPSQPRKSATP
jgi:hypothetical protein